MNLDLFDTSLRELLRQDDYATFRQTLADSHCQRCPLAQSRTHIVVDRGNPTAGLLLIGEGPGEQEDAQGLAFVGRAGQLLDKIMASVGLDTNRDMLIVNVVKCRPPENRAPRQEEVEACLPFLEHQIRLVTPRIVLVLGATALKHIDPSRKDFSMSDEAGKFFTLEPYPGVEFMVLYHPAALLYNANLKKPMWDHVRELKRRLDRQGAPP